MNAFLNKDELVTLTGFVNVSSQYKWLDSNDWIYSVNAKGFPVVGRDYCSARMAGGQITRNKYEQMPDFSKVA